MLCVGFVRFSTLLGSMHCISVNTQNKPTVQFSRLKTKLYMRTNFDFFFYKASCKNN